MKTNLKIAALIVLCLVMPLFTFGYAFNHTDTCWAKGDGFHNGCSVIIGTMDAVLWPLYWSVELQEKKP